MNDDQKPAALALRTRPVVGSPLPNKAQAPVRDRQITRASATPSAPATSAEAERAIRDARAAMEAAITVGDLERYRSLRNDLAFYAATLDVAQRRERDEADRAVVAKVRQLRSAGLSPRNIVPKLIEAGMSADLALVVRIDARIAVEETVARKDVSQ